MINFNAIEPKILKDFQGGQGEILARLMVDDAHRIIHSTYAPGASTGYHLHDASDEIIFILEGSCKVLHQGKEERLNPGDCHYCRLGESHAIINDGSKELKMFAVVSNVIK